MCLDEPHELGLALLDKPTDAQRSALLTKLVDCLGLDAVATRATRRNREQRSHKQAARTCVPIEDRCTKPDLYTEPGLAGQPTVAASGQRPTRCHAPELGAELAQVLSWRLR